MVKPGIKLADLEKKIKEVLAIGLIDLGFIKNAKDLWMFSGHGYSHWIGLEVHDVGAYKQNGKHISLESGMVFTIEPRLTVPGSGIVTVEEMVVVTESGAEYLSAPQTELIVIT